MSPLLRFESGASVFFVSSSKRYTKAKTAFKGLMAHAETSFAAPRLLK